MIENKLDELLEKVQLISTKILTKDLINKCRILNGAKYFSLGILQNYLAFASTNEHIFSKTQHIYSWKPKGIPEKSIRTPPGSDNTFALSLINNRLLPCEKLAGNCLSLSSISLHQNVVNLYISYTLSTYSRDLNTYFTLGNCLFGSVKLIKNADPDKYGYRDYNI